MDKIEEGQEERRGRNEGRRKRKMRKNRMQRKENRRKRRREKSRKKMKRSRIKRRKRRKKKGGRRLNEYFLVDQIHHLFKIKFFNYLHPKDQNNFH